MKSLLLRRIARSAVAGSVLMGVFSAFDVSAAESACPSQLALDLFRHEIAYQRTGELKPLPGLRTVKAEVWQRGHDSAFYVEDALSGYAPGIRIVYPFSNNGILGNFSCPVAKDWATCVRESFPSRGAGEEIRTCETTLDLANIPPWQPSPETPEKRKLAAELLAEIMAHSPGAQEVTIRDFNLRDPEITMVLKMPDGDFVQGCGLHVYSEPHCDGWHLFGMAPSSQVKAWVSERPYHLK